MRAAVLCAGLLILAWPTVATCAWQKASSPHFVIYADDKPEKLRAYAEKLEKFDQAVRYSRKMPDYPAGDGNRVTIYVTRSISAIQRLANDRNGFVAGFYVPHARGPVAFVPKTTGLGDMDADVVFFHEYSHHLMLQELDRPMPQWLVEGFAEFMSTAAFEKDGRVSLGRAANHRAIGLLYTEGLPLETLLAGNYGRLDEVQQESIYGRGWLLTHYLAFSESRKGQLTIYLDAIAQGVPALDAARKAFGDLKQLDRDLDRYLKQRTIMTLFLGSGLFKPVQIDIEPLSAGAAEVMPLRMESKRGVDGKTSEPLAVRVRKVEAAFPGDPLVELTLAEAEIDAGHAEASMKAADRVLSTEPKSVDAMIFKGRAIIARALESKTPDEKAFDDARGWFMRANKLDTEDPEPLMEFYNSFIAQKIAPTKNAVDALHYASNLVPQDAGLRLSSAMQYLSDNDLRKARSALVPLAYNPHESEMAKVAQKVVARIDAGDAPGALKAAAGGDEKAVANKGSS